FANFDRMRREMDELFGDVFERTRLQRRRAGFLPPVDVAYTSDPPRAIVTAELAGISLDELDLEIEGRTLILSGCRNPAGVQTDLYQQVEIVQAPDVVHDTPELTALMRNVQQTFTDIVEQVPYLPEELQIMVANVDDSAALSHLIAGALRLKTEEKQELLEELDVGKRLRRLSEI